jgi:hypothetical protein
MAYDLADVVPLTVETRDNTGALSDAGAVSLTIGLPGGTASSPAVTHASTGTYQVDYMPTMPGLHTVSWVATGANASGYPDVFYVWPAVPMALVSLADVKTQLRITTTDSDEELRGYISAATEIVERHRGETLVRRSITEEHYLPDYFRGYGQATNSAMPYGLPYRHRLSLNTSPVISLTSVARVDGTMTWDITLLHADRNGIVSVLFGPALSGHVTVTYLAGYQVIPDACLNAAKIIVQHLWDTKRGSRGIPRPGGMDDSLAMSHLGFAIPNRALELLGPGLPGFA